MNKCVSHAALLLIAVPSLFAQQLSVLRSTAPATSASERSQMSGRRVPGDAGLRRQAIQQKLRQRAARHASTFATFGPGWNSVGPLPLPSDASGTGVQDYGWVSGRATALAIDPNDPSGNTVFVGGAYGGVWKSTNAGPLSSNPGSVTWAPVTDDQLTLAIGAIAIQRQTTSPDPNRSVVLAGTGETNSSADSYYGLGILRSTDGGAHWALISQDATAPTPLPGSDSARSVSVPPIHDWLWLLLLQPPKESSRVWRALQALSADFTTRRMLERRGTPQTSSIPAVL